MNAPIVVGVDASRAAGDALFWAMADARRRETWVLLLHATDRFDVEVAARSGVAVSARAAGVVRAHRQHAARLAPDVRTHGQVSGGSAAGALVAASRTAGLLVLGSRGQEEMGESALGSIGQRVVAHAHCPVVVVPKGSSRLVLRRIAVAVAGLQPDDAVLEFAAEEAARWSAALCLVRASDTSDRDLAERELDSAAAYLRLRYRGVVVERTAPFSDPVEAIAVEAGRSDLLVLGCRHTEEEFGCRIGAVPAAVLARAACPVAFIGLRD